MNLFFVISRRKLKHTLLDHLDSVKDFFTEDDDEETYKSAIKSIHSTTVEETVRNYPVNRVLDEPPPDINKEEAKLPRKARSTLSQLRSGFSKMLNNYNHRIDPETPDSCPQCSSTPHDTIHLFNCPAKPTYLEPRHLWTNPIEVSTFLGLEEDVQDEHDVG